MAGNDDKTAGRPPGLAAYAADVTSQGGEDGILREIFRRLGTERGYCVEFGAWDGEHLSNTWSLWHEAGWSACLIEGDEERSRALEASVASFERVRVLRRWVSPSGEDRLDALLASVGAPEEPDLVSIDIDGDDYHVFASLDAFRPVCVVVEHNPTIPPEVDLVQRPGSYIGASARALLRLAHEKAYRLCACTLTNSLFVAEGAFGRLGIDEPALEAVFPRAALTWVLSAFDGSLLLSQVPGYVHRLKHRRGTLWPRDRRRAPAEVVGPSRPIPVEITLPRSVPEERGRPAPPA
jgi:hypothetical protein